MSYLYYYVSYILPAQLHPLLYMALLPLLSTFKPSSLLVLYFYSFLHRVCVPLLLYLCWLFILDTV